MRRYLFPVLVCAAMVPAVRAARAQSTPPPPPSFTISPTLVPARTPSPRPTAPPSSSGMALLQGMRGAMAASSPLQYALSATTVVPGQRQVVLTSQGVLSVGANAFHRTMTIVRSDLSHHPSTSVEERSELEVVGQRAAWRVPNMSWQCEPLRNADARTEILAYQFAPKTADILGTATLGGSAVTRVRGKGTLSSWTGNRIDTVEVDISQATGAALRVSATVPARLNGARATLTLVETYSHFGETVTITLPRKCTRT